MTTMKLTFWGAAAAGSVVVLAMFLVSSPVQITAQRPAGEAVRVGPDDIGGVVTSSKGPEAGVWVIAETTDLPTRFSKTVVTDDRGRYLIPELPKGNYTVWTRGYGMVDSAKTKSAPGKVVNLTGVMAPNSAAAAEYYPANYWYSLLQLPAKSEFPGTGPNGNGINPAMQSQAQWVRQIKTDSCESCHQLGTKATRTLPTNLGTFDSPAQAWARRIQSGQAGGQMANGLNALGAPRATAVFGDWTTRIAKGELPKEAPPRPQGVERNVVITQWDWADPKAYLHDEIATDKRNPTVNANGPLYGSPEESRDYLPVLDPASNTISRIQVPYRDPNTPGQPKPLQPSQFWGDEPIWDSHITVHNPMLDEKARLWFTSRVGVADNPAFCKDGSSHPSAKVFPLNASGRHLAMYDPKTKKVDLIRTCFSTHHLQFAEDANNTLWTSSGGGGGAVGWLNTKLWDQTHDEEKSQGWAPFILDTNGNGKRDAYVEPDKAVDPTKDKRLNIGLYGVTVSPKDGSIWGTVLGFPGAVVRVVPGTDPTHTALSEYYEVPWNNPNAKVQGFSPRGLDIDRNGVVWTVLASGHMASFDRSKCKAPLNGPNATGQHCMEGWTLYPSPGPKFKGGEEYGSADSHYYDWVDQFDTFGLGKNVPVATGNDSDSLLALVNGKWVILRVPYPIGFFAKGLDGRIDDPKTGWKGKGLWSTWSTRTPFHSETGKGTTSKVVKFQLRPDPLAR